MTQHSAEFSALLVRIDAEEPLDTAETLEIGKQPQLLQEILQYLHMPVAPAADAGELERAPARKRELTSLAIELGRARIPASGNAPERPGPIVTEPRVIEYLVSVLVSNDPEIRGAAFVALAGLVPAGLLASQALAIHHAVRLHPTEDGALLLLGKSADKADALKLLDEVPELAASDEDNAIMVRARLGEGAAETALLHAYQAAQDAEERGALALRLGYAATPRLIELLASEIRSAQHYVWNMRSRRSLRVHIIAGLHLAFPTEPVFWKPFFTPTSDAYYEGIEAWLKQRLGTSWLTPRPEFLYEEQAPSGR